MLRSVNRVLLALVGLALLALGCMLLIGGADLPRHWGFRMPGGWPWAGPSDVLLSTRDRTRWRSSDWFWPVVLGVLSAVGLLLLWWFLAQLHRRRLGEVLVEDDDGQGALLRGRALENVLGSEAESLDGVEGARVTLLGRRTEPRVRVGLLLAPFAEPGTAVRRLGDEALEHARTSAALEKLPAEVRMRAVRHRAQRVL